MNKIEEIFKSWNISFNPDESQSNLASQRISVCNSCEFKDTTLGFNRCSACGCALKKKVFSPVKGACPKGKWDIVDKMFLIKKEKKLRFICAQPATLYYAWQVEVLLNNFKNIGINLNDVDIVCCIDDKVSKDWTNLANKYAARFFFYKDTRFTKKYISSIRPNILKQHFKSHPYLKDEAIFYHDCDIMFTKNPTQWITSEMINDDNWYGSDTRWYIGYEYIKSKGEDVIETMSDIVGIPIQVIKDNELNNIGAQYLLKDISWYFWERVERESEMLYYEINNLNKQKIILNKNTEKSEYNPLQIWCADMWALLWNGWKMGKKTICHDSFDFSWATSGIKDFKKYNIFHNAGVTGPNHGMFYKGSYVNKVPFNDEQKLDSRRASYEYYNLIKQVAKVSVLK